MGIDNIKNVAVMSLCLLSMVGNSLEAKPFEELVVTNGLSYCREREYHHGGFVYPKSALGMNEFKEFKIQENEILEASYGAIRFMKYIYPRYASLGTELWSRNGLISVNSDSSFPAVPNKTDSSFAGHAWHEIRAVAFAFSVRNAGSENELRMVLLKLFYKKEFLAAIYYNLNTADADLSFIEASRSCVLVGQESNYPYLTKGEVNRQEKVELTLLAKVQRSAPVMNRPNSTSSTKEVEVFMDDL